MVTSNETFGDLEAAEKVGMVPYYLDRKSGKTLEDLIMFLEERYL